MDPTVVLILGVLWFIINLVSGIKKKPHPPADTPRGEPRRPEPRRPEPRQAQPQSLSDATQREGSRLEMVLRQFQQALEEGRPPEYLDEEVEDRESLETEPEVVSLEQDVRRASRREYTQDEDAEKLVQKRIAAAASRDTARSKADHLEFDRQIRKEPAEHTGTPAYTAKQLRDAVVWREILGPPVSER